MYKLPFNKITNSIIFVIITGFVIGILSTNKIDEILIQITYEKKSYVKVFLNAFSFNFWYLFIIWFLGMIPIGFIFTYIIVFIKSNFIGIIFGICLKSSAIFGIKEFILYSIFELIIIIPTLIYLSYQSTNNCFRVLTKSSYNNNYFNILIKTIIIIIIYSILTCLKMTFLEVK